MTQDRSRQASKTRGWYTPDQDRSLTEAVLDAIEDYKGEDLLRADFVLYEDVNPDALNSLFRPDAQSRTTVTFDTDGVTVELRGNGGVEIRVTDRSVD
ncbi:HalOD1 output domain-containing protein [Natronosalvus caseinilyticus]|uniref:HalOD1 output domain-containing protein n=1 Tax=Natronosalvus caseinilyticus TaxID=2953747 RepID=UPI0028B260BD|nr:HalOD1 output domain-containing protein [Natronosalvus caseinilyticus]